MILGHLQIYFVVTNVLSIFFKGSSRIFFLSTYAKICIFLWHQTLNQHIHIDIMYPFSITEFNTMILLSVFLKYIMKVPSIHEHFQLEGPYTLWGGGGGQFMNT
jgi:hypothetical protein